MTTSGTSPLSQPSSHHHHRPQWREAVAGACAGALAKTAVAPLERIKLLLQLQHSIQSNTPHYHQKTRALPLALTVYSKEGILAFWRGNTANVYQQAGTAGLNFMLMDWYRRVAVSPLLHQTLQWFPSTRTLEQRQRRRQLIGSFLSGGLAGGTATTVLYPIQFLRTRLAMDVGDGIQQTRLYQRGMRDALLTIYKSDGMSGLYQGYPISVVGVILYRALHLGGYDAVKTELLYLRGRTTSTSDANTPSSTCSGGADDDTTTLSWIERFAVAQTVSITAGTICYPIDSVRRRLMMQAGIPLSQRLYRNSMDCMRQVYRQEGVRGFYLGLGPNLVRSFGAALLLVTYDVFKVML